MATLQRSSLLIVLCALMLLFQQVSAFSVTMSINATDLDIDLITTNVLTSKETMQPVFTAPDISDIVDMCESPDSVNCYTPLLPTGLPDHVRKAVLATTPIPVASPTLATYGLPGFVGPTAFGPPSIEGETATVIVPSSLGAIPPLSGIPTIPIVDWQPPSLSSPTSSLAPNIVKRKPEDTASVSLPTTILSTPTYRPPTLTALPIPSDITSLASHGASTHAWMIGLALVGGWGVAVLLL